MPKDDNLLMGKEETTPIRGKSPVHQSDILPQTIKQRHLESNVYAVKFGLAADIPSGSTETKAFFATDTGELSMWDGSAWLSTTLS